MKNRLITFFLTSFLAVPLLASSLTKSASSALAPASISMNATTNDVISATTTLTGTANTEVHGFKFVGSYNDHTTNGVLPMTMFTQGTYTDSGNTSDHYVADFSRVIVSSQVRGFSAGNEGNNWCSAIGGTGAYCAGSIFHSVYLGPLTSTPTAQVIGGAARAEIVDPADTTLGTPRIGAMAFDIIAFSAQTYGGYSDFRRNYNFQSLTWGKYLNIGPGVNLSTYTQTIAGGDTIKGDACGGIKHITSASAVTTSLTNTFSASSILTDGTGTKDCEMDVVNEGAFTITLDNNAGTLTPGGIDQNLNSAAKVHVINTGGVWVTGQADFTASADVKLSTYPAVANAGTSGQYANQGSLPLTPGDWSLNGVCEVAANGATVTDATMAISINTGNTTSDQSQGLNQVPMTLPIVGHNGGGSVHYDLAVAAATTVFVKVQAAYTAGPPLKLCSLTARRYR